MQIFNTIFSLVIVAALAACQPQASTGAANSADAASVKNATPIDPRGDYIPRSDPAITIPPAPDLVLGDGSVVTLGYDGSKGVGLSFQLFYIRDSGSVAALNSASFDAKGGGKFVRDIVVFDSDSDGRAGFIELSTMYTPARNPAR